MPPSFIFVIQLRSQSFLKGQLSFYRQVLRSSHPLPGERCSSILYSSHIGQPDNDCFLLTFVRVLLYASVDTHTFLTVPTPPSCPAALDPASMRVHTPTLSHADKPAPTPIYAYSYISPRLLTFPLSSICLHEPASPMHIMAAAGYIN